MDRSLTGRILFALAALILALAAGIAVSAAAEDDWPDPSAMDGANLAEFSGWLTGMATICRSYAGRFYGDSRIQAIRDHYAENLIFQREFGEARYIYRGVDGFRGGIQKFCDKADKHLDKVADRLKNSERKQASENILIDQEPSGSEIILHAEMRGDNPFSIVSKLTLGRMPNTLFVRNAYRNLVPGGSYVRQVSFYDPQGKYITSSQYRFIPASAQFNVWHWVDNPARRFIKPGDWRIVTRLSGGEFNVENSRVLTVEGKEGEGAREPRLEKARLSCHSADQRELFARVLAREGENPDAADKLRVQCAGEFIIKIEANLAELPWGNSFYYVQIRQPDGIVAGADGLHFSAENNRKEVQTIHSIKIDDIISRPGNWKIQFFVGSRKVGERIVRISR